MKKRLVYYMHPINTYGTQIEEEQLRDIEKLFPLHEYEVINPNDPVHNAAYVEMKEKDGDGMPYFTDLAKNCDIGIALPFSDGKFGAGISKEILALIYEFKPVWNLPYNNVENRITKRIMFLNDDEILSVEETRERIQKPFVT